MPSARDSRTANTRHPGSLSCRECGASGCLTADDATTSDTFFIEPREGVSNGRLRRAHATIRVTFARMPAAFLSQSAPRRCRQWSPPGRRCDHLRPIGHGRQAAGGLSVEVATPPQPLAGQDLHPLVGERPPSTSPCPDWTDAAPARSPPLRTRRRFHAGRRPRRRGYTRAVAGEGSRVAVPRRAPTRRAEGESSVQREAGDRRDGDSTRGQICDARVRTGHDEPSPEKPLARDRAARKAVLRRARAYREVMADHAFFVGRSAAVIYELPIAHGKDLEVGVQAPSRAPRGRGIRGIKVQPALVEVSEHDGLRVANAASTWAMLGGS